MSLPQSRSPHDGPCTATAGTTPRSSHFEREIENRADRARASVERANAEGEEYLAEVHLSELESLVRLAQDHDVELAAARDYLQQHRTVDLVLLEEPVTPGA